MCNSKQIHEVPDGWRWVDIGDVAPLHHDDIPSGSLQIAAAEDAALWFVPLKDVDEEYVTPTKIETPGSRIPDSAGMVVLAVQSDVLGRKLAVAMVAGGGIALGEGLIGVRPAPDVDPVFLMLCLTGLGQKLLNSCTDKNASIRDVMFHQGRSDKLLLPPLQVQKAIVANIQNEFESRDSETYRAGVLQALAEGRVRESWWSEKRAVDEAILPLLQDWTLLLRNAALLPEIAANIEAILVATQEPTVTLTAPGAGNEVGDRQVLRTDVEKEEAIFRGRTCHLDQVHVRILDVLNKAKGNPVTRARMQEADHLLSLESRLDRVIKKLPPPFNELIRSSEEGYWLDLTVA